MPLLTPAKRAQHISAAEAASLVANGMWLDYGLAIGQPDAFDKALGARAREVRGVKIRSCLTLRPRAYHQSDPAGEHVFNTSWFFSGYDRRQHDAGRCNHLPLNLGEWPDLYRRFIPPLVNMGSLLLAPLGGVLALKLAGMPISMPVLIGMLMLFGIVAKNSILLVDFALEEMDKGVETFTAIMNAGHKRAQPIVMTTVAMVAGMIPTALSLSGDGSWRAPMGITVIGGLLLSTVLTLVIVPASFSLAMGIERWIGPRLGRKLLTYRAEDAALPGQTVNQGTLGIST